MATTQEAVRVERRLFTTGEYDRMVEVGILDEDDRVELIEGEIIRMAAMGPPHARCMRRTCRLLYQRLGDTATISIQLPLVIPRLSEPEPDIAVLRHREDDYTQHPTPQDVLLLIEISDTSLDYDRSVKLPLYARAGIQETVLVDLNGSTIERHTQPTADGYRQVARFERGQVFRSTVLPSLELPVDDVIGR